LFAEAQIANSNAPDFLQDPECYGVPHLKHIIFPHLHIAKFLQQQGLETA